MNKKAWGTVFGVSLTLSVALTGVQAATAHDDGPNRDPHNGQQVKLFPTEFGPVTKQCDGPNLVYLTPYSHLGAGGGGSISVIPDSPECK